jgi:hypothetical protein
VALGAFVCGVAGAIITRIGWQSALVDATEIDRGRITWLEPMIASLFPLVFAIKWKRSLAVLFWLALLAAIGVSGFRSRLVGFLVVTWVYCFFHAKSKIRFFLASGLIGSVLWVGIIFASPHFSIGMQRSVSFIPGVNIQQRVTQNAKGSVEWRLEIWRYCLEQVPEYLIVGRGSAFDLSETLSQIGQEERTRLTPWLAFLTRNYHSGPLALLLDYGLLGFIAAVWLTILVFKRLRSYSYLLVRMPNTFESRYILFLCASLIWEWSAFYLVYGSVRSFSENITSYALVIVLMSSLISLQLEQGGVDTTPDDNGDDDIDPLPLAKTEKEYPKQNNSSGVKREVTKG